MNPSVCVIIVNYKTWQETAECVESVLKNDYDNYQVVVVENGSPNDSWDCLMKWAHGTLTYETEAGFKLPELTNPRSPKPLWFETVMGDVCADHKVTERDGKMPVLFINSIENLGFAGGNNIATVYAINNNFDYVWLINNDAVMHPAAITELVKFAEQKKKEGKRYGIIGCKLLMHHDPAILQGLGAVFNKYIGKSKIIGAQEIDKGQYDHKEIKFNVVIGAAMFIPREFLQDVGLMSEEYFLYNEEPDWSARGKLKGWDVATVPAAIFYHKQGTSTNQSPKKGKWHFIALQYKYRGKIKLYRKYYRPYLPFLYYGYVLRILNDVRKGNYKEAKVILQSMFNIQSKKFSQHPKNFELENKGAF